VRTEGLDDEQKRLLLVGGRSVAFLLNFFFFSLLASTTVIRVPKSMGPGSPTLISYYFFSQRILPSAEGGRLSRLYLVFPHFHTSTWLSPIRLTVEDKIATPGNHLSSRYNIFLTLATEKRQKFLVEV
jgi:hypothetical protein